MSRRTIVLVVALLLAAAAAFAIWNFLTNVEDDAKAGLVEVPVYRATVLVDRGSRGDEVITTIEESTENSDFVPTNAIVTQEQLEAALRGRVALGPISAGQIVTTDVWGDPVEAVATMSELIAPGMQAVSIRPDETRSVGGFVRPGDRVNVIASVEVDLTQFINLLRSPAARDLFFPGLQEALGYDDEQMTELVEALPIRITVTKFVLQGLDVLAVGSEAALAVDEALISEDSGTEESTTTVTGGAQIFTLEVDPVQAEQLVYSQEYTKTWLTLVPEGFEPVDTPGAELEDLVDVPAQVLLEIQELAELVNQP